VRELKNIEHPLRLYRVVTPAPGRSAAAGRAPPDAVEASHATQPLPWTDALLHPSSLVPFLVGAYLLATRFGLPPAGKIFPAAGAVLIGVGVGRALRLRTGRRALFLIALGAGLLLASVSAEWRSGTPWWLVLGGVVVLAVGLARLR